MSDCTSPLRLGPHGRWQSELGPRGGPRRPWSLEMHVIFLGGILGIALYLWGGGNSITFLLFSDK